MRADLEMLDDQIFTILVDYVKEHLEEPELSDDNFSTTKSNPMDSELPFVYLKRINGIEMADDLEADELRGGLYTYEIRVTSNVSQDEVTAIMNTVTKAMKSMAFVATSLPVYADTDNLHIKVARWQREFDDGDII